MNIPSNVKINLGAGDKHLDGYLNVDICCSPDLRIDLEQFPWPWENDSVDEVYSSHFLEHVNDFEKTILEIHRILKPGGIIHFQVPHQRSPLAAWHLHRWLFSVYTPELLCQSIPYQWNGKKLFEKKQTRIVFCFIRKSIAKPLEWMANIYPLVWDWLGLPIDCIDFIGVKN